MVFSLVYGIVFSFGYGIIIYIVWLVWCFHSGMVSLFGYGVFIWVWSFLFQDDVDTWPIA